MPRSLMRPGAAALLLAALTLVLAGCGSGGSSSSTSTSSTSTSEATGGATCPPGIKVTPTGCDMPKPTEQLSASKTYDVEMTTSEGSFTIQLDQKQSPNAAASVVSLANKGFYNGTIFHRIVTGFIIQGGDPTGTGSGGPGYTTVDTPPAGAQYTHGVVAMAKTAAQPPGTAGSQFFVVTAPDSGLTPDYAIIGTVVKGLDVVDKIGTYGSGDEAGTPTKTVSITSAVVTTH